MSTPKALEALRWVVPSSIDPCELGIGNFEKYLKIDFDFHHYKLVSKIRNESRLLEASIF
jgi:hypothetical protein